MFANLSIIRKDVSIFTKRQEKAAIYKPEVIIIIQVVILVCGVANSVGYQVVSVEHVNIVK